MQQSNSFNLGSSGGTAESRAAKHTPGPWEVGHYGNSFIVTAKDRMYDVAVVRTIGNEDNAANASLIAAAPALLEALQRAVEILSAHAYDTEPYRSVIAKAQA